MRYAVLRTGGKQYRVAAGQVVEIEKIEAEAGSEVEFTDVLMVADDGKVTVGKPVIDGAKVIGRVLAQDRDAKIVVYKYKPKKRYRRTRGHRQYLTRLAITDITV